MKTYKVTLVPEAEAQIRKYLAYLLLVKQSEQAYNAVKEDYHETIDALSTIAGSIGAPPQQKLRDRGIKKMLFQRHQYVMLFYVDGEEAVVTKIFHTSEDYLNKLD